MKTFNEWFLSLPDGEQAILKQDKWMLADAAFRAGQLSDDPPDTLRPYEYEAEIHGFISKFTFNELNNDSFDDLFHKIMQNGKGQYNPRLVKNILLIRMGSQPVERPGGNMYKYHPLYLKDRLFWRCKHGLTGFDGEKFTGCIDCYNDFIMG